MLILLNLSFSFYRKFIWVSLLLNLIFISLEVPAFLALIYKTTFVLGLLWFYKFEGKGKKLIFYNNLKLSTTRLFSLCFIYDITLLLSTYLLAAVIL